MAKLLYKIRSGSFLYGLDTKDSDTDYMSIILPDLKDIILNKYTKAESHSTKDDKTLKNTSSDIDNTVYSLDHYIHGLKHGHINVIESLFAPPRAILTKDDIFQFFIDNRKMFLNKNIDSFIGLAKSHRVKSFTRGVENKDLETMLQYIGDSDFAFYKKPKLKEFLDASFDSLKNVFKDNIEIINEGTKDAMLQFYNHKYHLNMPLETFKNNLDSLKGNRSYRSDTAMEYGFDFKGLYHGFRCLYEFRDILMHEEIRYPFTGDKKDFLIALKSGEAKDLNYLDSKFNDLLSEVAEMQKKSVMKDKMSEKDSKSIEDYYLGLYIK